MSGRLAIVGGGPRAVFALECLARRHASGSSVPSAIDIFEPRPLLGTGSAYVLDQPDWIRLNVPIEVLTGESAPKRRGPGEEDDYPPRSAAGRYLVGLAHTSIAALTSTDVRHVHSAVTSMERSDGGFVLGPVESPPIYDDVLIVSGHAGEWSGQLGSGTEGRPVVPALPIDRLMAFADRHRPKRALIRGASLTAIDAMLGLTQGMGGSFVRDPDGSGSTYVAGETDVRLTMLSRSGRLMSAKTESVVLARYRVNETAAPYIAEFERSGPPDVERLIRDVAAALGRSISEALDPSTVIEEALDRPDDDHCRDRLERSLRMARGLEPPDAAWAVGQAWRCCYSSLVRLQRSVARRDSTATLGWDGYSERVAELERLAFGPPPVNVEKMLALMDSGHLSVEKVGIRPWGDWVADHDIVVDAVSAPPGIEHVEDPVWAGLLAAGLVSRAPYGRGIRVDEAAGCLDAEGFDAPGLSAVGRMTEDFVLGNDTLSRSMHTEMERWADRLCRLREQV